MTNADASQAESVSIRVVLADDQATIRDALAMMLDLFDDIDVVGAGADGAELVALTREHRPDVVLTDLRMPALDGAAATARILAEQPDLPVVVLTTFDDDESIFAALDAGARGYLTKDAGRAEIAAAIRAAAAGQSVLDPAVQTRLVRAAVQRGSTTPPTQSTAAAADLTAREREVLGLIAGGLTNREIASRLFIGESTVKTHINNLFAKASLRDRAAAVAYAFQTGIAGPAT